MKIKVIKGQNKSTVSLILTCLHALSTNEGQDVHHGRVVFQEQGIWVDREDSAGGGGL